MILYSAPLLHLPGKMEKQQWMGLLENVKKQMYTLLRYFKCFPLKVLRQEGNLSFKRYLGRVRNQNYAWTTMRGTTYR